MFNNQGTKQREQRTLGDCWQWKVNGQCSKGDKMQSSVTILKARAKLTQPNPSPNFFMQQYERNESRTRSPRGKGASGRMSRWPCKDYLKGTCTKSCCEKWHPPECLWLQIWEKCSYALRQVDEQSTKRSKKNDDKSAVAMLKKGDWNENVRKPVVNRDKSDLIRRRDTCHELKRRLSGSRSSNARQLCCVFQDMKPPKYISPEELRYAETRSNV